MTMIIWREWYGDEAVAKMTEMGTLPRYEIDIDTRLKDGERVAAEIAERRNREDSELFRNGGKIVIIEPKEFAGSYEICVRFSAHEDL